MFRFRGSGNKRATIKKLPPKSLRVYVRSGSSDDPVLISENSLNIVGLKRWILQNLLLLLQEVLLFLNLLMNCSQPTSADVCQRHLKIEICIQTQSMHRRCKCTQFSSFIAAFFVIPDT